MASCSAVWSEDAKYFSWMPRVLREGMLRLRHSRRGNGFHRSCPLLTPTQTHLFWPSSLCGTCSRVPVTPFLFCEVTRPTTVKNGQSPRSPPPPPPHTPYRCSVCSVTSFFLLSPALGRDTDRITKGEEQTLLTLAAHEPLPWQSPEGSRVLLPLFRTLVLRGLTHI